MARTKPDEIARTRWLILEALGVGRAIAMRGEQLWRIVRAQVESEYESLLFEKDLRYLRERGYVRINAELSGARAEQRADCDLGPQWHLVVYWELTAAGLDVAQGLATDPALEF